MAGEWGTASLGELCDFRAGSVFKPGLQGRSTGEFPFVKVSDMNLPANAVRIQDANNWVSGDDLRELRAKPFPPGTVVFAKIGEALRQNRLRQVARETIVDNNMMGAVPRVDRIDARYFYYALSRFDFSEIAQGTALPYLTVASLSALTLDVPPAAEQRAIAHILGTLDDKIELNRRMNETLEAIARAIFKSWFVDFDPVRAKAEGRDAGLPKPLADLFPARLVDSDLGEVPEGWEVKVLEDLIGVVLGGDWGGDEPTPENTMPARCIRGADIPDLQAGGMGKMPIRYLKPSSLQKRRLADGDLVVEISGGSPTQSTGRPVLVSDRLLRRLNVPLVCSNFCRLLKPKKRVYSKFVYLWLRALYSSDEFLQFENGTTGIKNLAFTLFSSSYRLYMPPDGVLTGFETQVAPLFAKQQSAAAETDSLAALRDMLLPKLTSGDLRVRDAERLQEVQS